MPRYAFTTALLVMAALAPRPAAASESLKAYADKCTKAIGMAVPEFDCNAGTLVPTDNASGGNCDRPNMLNEVCDPGSYFQVFKTTSPDIVIVAMCRKKGADPTKQLYRDIAVIQHSRKTGATCFYQMPTETAAPLLDGHVLSPSNGYGSGPGKSPWFEPSTTAGIGCGECHDNGPIVRSPYLSQITGKDALPSGLNGPSALYKFVGEDFKTWKSWSITPDKNVCTSCHRMGLSSIRGLDSAGNPRNGGTSIKFGIIATAATQNSRNSTMPPWMQPGSTAVDPDDQKAAAAIKACAEAFRNNPKSLPSGCHVAKKLLADAYP